MTEHRRAALFYGSLVVYLVVASIIVLEGMVSGLGAFW